MNFLVVDGNSIVNRAFFGIKMLTTKDGHFTNAIYGFLNMFLKMKETCNPEAVAIAFDLKAPTFRHKMYDEYKAGRKGMPPELAEQMPILKDLLRCLGYKIVELEGYEADDILGTLSASCPEGNHCYIATGDRDSLQLVSDNVSVLLASTKQTTCYTPETIMKEYGVTPEGLIEMKGLMGDSSDNIPGVKGVGPKTAGTLIKKYGTIDYIYDHLDEIETTPGIRKKLEDNKELAFLSRTLGTICLDAPIDTDISNYEIEKGEPEEAARILLNLEMFSMIDRFSLRDSEENGGMKKAEEKIEFFHTEDYNKVLEKLDVTTDIAFIPHFEKGVVKYVYFTDGQNYVKFHGNNVTKGFKEFLCNEEIQKISNDIKPIYRYGLEELLDVKAIKLDTSLAGYILNPSSESYDPVRLYGEYNKGELGSVSLPVEDDEEKEIVALSRVFEKLETLIFDNGQDDLLEMEMELALVLASMELYGFQMDREGLEEYGKLISKKQEEISRIIYDAAGYEFNLNSPKQLGEALFEKMGIPPKKKTKTGYSTSASVLESLAEEYPVVRDVLEYRTVSKLNSTYCEGLLKVISSDGRIHSTLNQKETRTGRISSSEPNLQNIPVRKPLGSELRKFFIAKPGYVLIDADYSQIELRVLAHMADDEVMIEAFKNGDDIHKITASQVFGVPPEFVNQVMRSRAKAVNFGIVYGIGAFSLAKDLGVTRKEAADYIEGYLHHFSGVSNYMDEVVKRAKKDGFVSTLYGRRRYLPELTASNRNIRAFGERVARNMPVQGTAADIIKVAMIRVYRRLEEERLDAHLVMQVHDELIVEAEKSVAEKVRKIVIEEMEHACNLSVQMSVDAGMGESWYVAKE